MGVTLALLAGVGAGAAVAWLLWGRPLSARRREALELDARLRRLVIPVLERRADVLAIPPSERGRDADGALALTLTLASAIKEQEESVDLPFGDTVEVARAELDEELRARGRRPEET
ncbi:MAG: hypothetical protein VYE22_16065 [Myxococcota bacterium]|nr:hypothetical protein [Myxococcota bacterium]